LGAGESGTGAALLANNLGYEVFISEKGAIKEEYAQELHKEGLVYEEGGHNLDKILAADFIIKSPGIPDDIAPIVEANRTGIQVLDEIEFASRHSHAKFVAITGTNGKTTTARMIYHLMAGAEMDVEIAGNIGTSLSRALLERDQDWFVLELSSFQIDYLHDFHPTIAVLLNISRDHLDRYGNDFSKYIASKMRITRNLGPEDLFVYWSDDEVLEDAVDTLEKEFVTREITLGHRKAYGCTSQGQIHIGELTIPISEIPLKGQHNLVNAMCALAVAHELGIGLDQLLPALKSFQNDPHRMEYVDTINNVQFINDSKATNVESTYYALDAFDKTITWIAGGVDKGNDYSKLIDSVKNKVQALVCLGQNNSKLIDAFDPYLSEIDETTDVQNAIRKAYEHSDAHHVVLLSPACASFDLFENYEDRGNKFKEAVRKLKEEVKKQNEAL